ncbi:M20 aminoacylase family protein [Burkholderia sp. S171]|uniref:M20 aminoacylase family protein n=1 Tax=Burkholderia sp. S171 TaxID=1641860 RepID=UPI00131DD86B|nr:M20 aminoacylase family protein [Burkholderia sp. S171]
MAIIDEISAFHAEMTSWRRDFHANPELAFNEFRTSQIIVAKLREFGIEVHCGLAGTGVVGTLRTGSGNGRSIALRADMDALPILEKNDFAHASKTPGVMHACGHDGHTAMLLGAARYLALTRSFDGTVFFVFQPAEENEGGGRVMVEDGLFEQFPADTVYGLHNWPGLPTGTIAVQPGPMMACFDVFEIELTGRGGHAGMPHLARDVVLAASRLVDSLQSIVARRLDPLLPAVVSVTQLEAGTIWNVLPDLARIRGTVRAMSGVVQDKIEESMREIAAGVAASFDVEAAVRYERRVPPTINSTDAAQFAAKVAIETFGAGRVSTSFNASMAAEDFAFMLQAKPGAYAWIGCGEDHAALHNPYFDFNDNILPVGASFLASLAERTCGSP